ncbi:hypothetical protein [Spiroplasma endosymbiont of Polydrusus formosus]
MKIRQEGIYDSFFCGIKKQFNVERYNYKNDLIIGVKFFEL